MMQCLWLTPRKSFVTVALVLFCCTTVLTVEGQKRPTASAEAGTAQVGPGREVVLSELPTMSQVEMMASREAPAPRNPHFSEAAYRVAKMAASQVTVGSRPQDAARGQMAPRNPNTDAGPATPGAVVNVFGQFEGCNGTAWRPSDMGLAVSKNFVVQAVNECISVYNKTGALLLGPTDLCTFFGRTPNSGFAGCFDPRVIYDYQKNKFIVIASFQNTGTGEGFIDIAASKTADPRGAWIIHHISRGQALPDYPTIGQTANNNNTLNSVITVCDNLFGNSGSFTAECLLLPKKGVYAAPAFGFSFFFNFNLGGTLMNTLQPVNVYEVEENPRAQYAVNSVNTNGGGVCGGSPCSGLVVWAFSDATGAQGAKATGVFTGFGSTSTYTFPGDADNAGFCSACIDTLDNRISGGVHYASGRIYPSINANNGGRSAVLGWTVRPFLTDNGAGCTGGVNCATISSATIEQEWCYDCGAGTGLQAYYGAQIPMPENDWTMFATFSNTTTSPGMFYASNRVSWPTPFHDAGIFSCQQNAAYTQGRWGDYAAAAADIPGKGNVPGAWGSGMFVQANGNWGTCITENRPHDGP